MRNIKNKRIVKMLIGALIFIAILMATNGVKASTSRGLNPFDALTGKDTWDGWPMYCVENGQHFSVNDTYKEIATGNLDLYLGYIANNYTSNNPRNGNFGIDDKGQNLIWRYIDSNYQTRGEFNIHLNNARGYGLRPGGYNSGLIAEDWNNVTNYVDRINNAQVYINNLKLDGSNISFEYGGNADSYTIIANGKNIQTTSSISVNDIDSKDGKITIEVVGTWKIYTGKYKLLLNTSGKSNRQALIALIPESYTITRSASATIQANIEVSMQKYITKVNGKDITETENKTSLIDRKNTYPNPKINDKEVAKSETMQKPKQYKNENVVAIEAGDYVTYRIHVYNNSAYTASKITITDTLPKGVTKYSINGNAFKEVDTEGKFTYDISNLIGNASTYFDVTVYFGTYTDTNPLINHAEISSTMPPNKTNYRTKDEDYVYMKKYAVSLEKYISGTTSSNNNDDINEDTRKEYMDKYGEIIKYLNNNKNETIATLIGNLSGKNIDNIEDYDINGDGKVDIDSDIEWLKNYGKYFSIEEYTNIYNYIEYDLNKDGKVDKYDYITKYLDLNKDGKTNSLDYIYYMLYNAKVTNDKQSIILQNLKLYEEKVKNIGTDANQIKSEIEGYIKRDVNDDGFANVYDKCIVNKANDSNYYERYIQYKETKQITKNIKDNSDYINKISNNKSKDIPEIIKFLNMDIMDYTNLSIYDIDKIIKNFDVNSNDRIDDNDIELLNNYFEDYANNTNIIQNKIEQIKKLNIEQEQWYLEYIYGDENLINENLGNNIECDLNNDNSFTNKDYELYLHYLNVEKVFNTIKESNNDGSIGNLWITNLQKLMNDYNLIKNEDYKDTYSEDEYKQFGFDGLGEEDVSFIKVEREWKTYTEKEIANVNYYDLNDDGMINTDDLDMINAYISNQGIINIIVNQVDSLYFNMNDIINVIKKFNYWNVENNIDMVKYYYNTRNTTDDEFNSFVINQLMAYNLDVHNFNDETFYGQYANTQNSNWFNEELWRQYDYNGDKYVNITDLQKIKENKELISNATIEKIKTLKENLKDIQLKDEDIETLKKKLKNIELKDINDIKSDPIILEAIKLVYIIDKNDLNKDGIWDENDSKLKEQVDQIKTNENEKNLIAKIVETNVATSSKRTGINKEGIFEKAEYYDKSTYKYNNPVEVKNGEYVTYTIRVRNDGETGVYITEITDYLPNGVKYANISYTGNTYCTKFNSNEKTTYDADGTPSLHNYNGIDIERIIENRQNKVQDPIKLTNTAGIYLIPGETTSFTVTVQVIEPNMSVNVLRNVAVISEMKNKNQVNVIDSTPDDNTDSDYIQLKGSDNPDDPKKPDDTSAYIKGTVWNDIAQNKTQNNYNGIWDSNEKKLEGIIVELYREGIVNKKDEHTIFDKPYAVAVTTTDSNGNYKFIDKELNANKNLKENEELKEFIKGPKSPNTGRWTGEYYTYYVVFEYDGITYTSARYVKEEDGKIVDQPLGCDVNCSGDIDVPNASNAHEEKYEEYFYKNARKLFNDRFSTINNSSGIKYTTTNEKDYAPQSNHEYDSETMRMHSSTNLINMKHYDTKNGLSDTPLSHVNLGLRGRDIFDLELTTDVYSVKVGVNGQSNTYMYDNKVTLRKSDLNSTEDSTEDMANKEKEGNIIYSSEQTQGVRKSDVVESLAITVTYKITVQNTSNTAGTATKITNYFDSYYYQDPKVYSDDKKIMKLSSDYGESGNGFNSIDIEITPVDTLLDQSETMDIYVEYTVKPNAATTLTSAGINNAAIPTYNMSEITEYRTKCGKNQTEYTRGLIDKDSAPGSANTEEVRLAPNETGNLTTVQYYFAGNNLKKLKYEDDTYATPVLYFSTADADGNEYNRTINGTVFEDYTIILEEDNNRVKTGNGIKDDAEPGIYGVTVELYEITKDDTGNVKNILRATTETNKDGVFTFTDFLPGNYYIRYHYGDTDKTFLVNEPNTESYNGEDFESTNNTGKTGDIDRTGEPYNLRKLSDTENYWYIDNEGVGISTATDNSETRKKVSAYASNLDDAHLIFLNSVRDGLKKIKTEDIKMKNDILDNTKMYADTKPMLFTLEKCDNKGNQPKVFGKYVIENMNFGIAEVPVTKIDLQKNVYSFRITDVTGTNTIAQLHIDKDNTIVKINPSKISTKKQAIVKKVLVDNLKEAGIDGDYIQNIMNNKDYQKEGSSIPVKDGTFKYSDIEKLKKAITQSSLAREIQIVYAWKVDKGEILAPAGTTSLDVSIENEKLQGAKLEITYELSASMYTEVDFNNINTRLTPSITGLTDYVDNNLTYNKDSAVKIGDKEYKNEDYWTVSEKTNVEDPNKVKHTTVVEAKTGNELLLQKVGEGKAYITLEKVLSSTDSTLEQIIKSTVDSYEYNNIIEITAIDYKNTTTEETGNHEYKDRIQTTDRFTILPPTKSNDGDKIITPGSHNWTSSQEIAIHPPTGENKGITYLILGIASLVILAGGVFVIKKFVLKK